MVAKSDGEHREGLHIRVQLERDEMLSVARAYADAISYCTPWATPNHHGILELGARLRAQAIRMRQTEKEAGL